MRSVKVFIAEKPSLAGQIVKSLEKHTKETFTKRNGYYESRSYIVTWCYGHLFELYDIDDYIGTKTKWSEVELPYIPKHFEYKEKEGVHEQVQVISRLVNAKTTEEVIHSCDSDNEGEVIGRIAIQKTLKRKVSISRLWSSDTTEDSLWRAYQERKPDSAYDKDFNAGQSRAFADWLVGINSTRAITVQSGTLFNIGRVITPIVQKVVDRDREREQFKVRKFWSISCAYCSSGKELTSKKEAEELSKKYNQGYEVISFTEKERTVGRPKLFSQTTLQNAMSNNGIAPDKVLSICQKLYEKGYTTYPRTDSEFLTNDEVSKVKQILSVYGSCYAVTGKEKCFNSKKVASHSAIIPTGREPQNLKKEEALVYEAIKVRFLVNFHKEECIVKDQKCTICIDKEELNFNGLITIQNGWCNKEKALSEEETKVLPKDLFSVGKHTDPLGWKAVQRTTQKPPAITVSALNTWCEHPFRGDTAIDKEYGDIAKGLTIGTPATRAGIIKKAIDGGYLELKGQKYNSTDKGRELVRVIEENSIPVNAELSVRLQSSIQNKTKEEVVEEATELTENIVKKIQKAEVKKVEKEKITAKCPWCGEELVRIQAKTGKVYYTHPSHKDPETGEYVKETNCQFFIGTELKYYGQNIELTPKRLDILMQKGEVKVAGVPSKYGTFTATMFIEPEPNEWNGKQYVQVNFKDKKYDNK